MSDTEDQTEAELEKTRQVVAAQMADQIAANETVLAETPAEEVEAVDPWDGWTVDDLKTALSDADLKVSGNRDELIARLDEAGITPT